MSSIGIRHIGIVVNDLNKMIEFYNLLGFEKFVDTEIKGKFVEKLIGINNADIRIVKLKAKDDSIIELLQYKDTYFFKDKIKLNDKGITHLAITVENIDEIFKSLKSKGIEFISSPMITEDNVKVCFCRDVEDNFLELVEELKMKNNSNSYINVVYDQKSHPPSKYPQELINYLVGRFNVKKSSKILDCGCGRGDFSRAWENAGMEVTKVDLCNNGDLDVYEANFEIDRLPFEDNTFDVCFSKSILEHITNIDHHISEIHRILKPGGKFLVMVPEWDSCQFLFYDDHTHKQPYRLNTLRDLLLIHNFQDVFVQRFVQLPVVWKYPILKIVCWFLQLFGAPKKIVRNKFLRWSRELLICGVGTKSL